MASKKDAAQQMMNVLVTVDEQYRHQLDKVESQLKSAGMKVAEKIELGGVIAGEVAQADLSKLHTVEGVASVEEEPIFSADV